MTMLPLLCTRCGRTALLIRKVRVTIDDIDGSMLELIEASGIANKTVVGT